MSVEPPQDLEQLIRACGEDWLIDSFSPKEKAVANLKEVLKAASSEANRRGLPIRLSEQDLVSAYKAYAGQVDAFLQALGATREPAMLVMVWRIIQGMTISQIRMEYENGKSFKLSVELTSPYGEPSEQYDSININDAALLRHLGIMTMDNKPLFDGFYALKVG
jgi:hypothetical protein